MRFTSIAGRRVQGLALVLTMSLGLAACSDSKDPSTAGGGQTSTAASSPAVEASGSSTAQTASSAPASSDTQAAAASATPTETAPAAPDVAGDISFYAVVNDNFTKSFWGRQIDAFEAKYPKVKVKLIDSAGQDYDGYAKTLLASGQFPDVAHNLAVADYVKKDLLKPYEITDAVKTFRGYENLQNGGKLYFLPTAVQPKSLIFYNKDAFAKAGITETPKTLDALGEVMAKLKAVDTLPMLISGEWTTGAQYSFLAEPTVFGTDPLWYAARASDKATFAGSGWSTVAKRFEEWNKSGYFGKGALSKTYDSGLKDFLAGKAAMYPMGVWVTANAVSTPPKFNIGVFNSPSEDGKSNVSVGYGLKYTVSSKSKSSEAATAFATFMATEKAVVSETLKADGLLSNAEPAITYVETPLQAEVSELLKNSTLVPDNGGAGDSLPAKGLADEINLVMQSVLLNKTDADGAMKKLDTFWKSNS